MCRAGCPLVVFLNLLQSPISLVWHPHELQKPDGALLSFRLVSQTLDS